MNLFTHIAPPIISFIEYFFLCHGELFVSVETWNILIKCEKKNINFFFEYNPNSIGFYKYVDILFQKYKDSFSKSEGGIWWTY